MLPPSTPQTEAVTKPAAELARKAMTRATSSGVPSRRIGSWRRVISCSTAAIGSMLWWVAKVSAKPPGLVQNGVHTGPGAFGVAGAVVLGAFVLGIAFGRQAVSGTEPPGSRTQWEGDSRWSRGRAAGSGEPARRRRGDLG